MTYLRKKFARHNIKIDTPRKNTDEEKGKKEGHLEKGRKKNDTRNK